ncbi:MAG: toxic anion resistance protein, partial [Nitrosopumilus sp.]|nr:toxic anion resistance protein [Nitrosopumilus sp.]
MQNVKVSGDVKSTGVYRENYSLLSENQLVDAAGSAEMKVLDDLANVGMDAQRATRTDLELLKSRMGDILDQGGTGKEIASGVQDLRSALKEIAPEQVTHRSLVSRAIGAVPLVSSKYNPVVRALSKVAVRYEPISAQVTAIETKLLDGRALLVRDNLELRKLYEDVETQQLNIQKNAYLGELLVKELAALHDSTDDPFKRDRLEVALHDVAVRVQDLRTIEQVHLQYFVSIEIGRQNNNRLGQSVERTVALATNVVTVGLAIQSALVRQKRVQEATRRTRDFLGDLVAANASSIRTHTEEIGDLYNSPVIAVDKIIAAHDDLIEALNTASQLRHDGIASARENVARLTRLSAELAEKVGGLGNEVS